MAKAKQPRLNAMTFWMILFVGLWLTATVVLVILYTGQEDLRNEMARLTDRNAKLISGREWSSLELVKRARKTGPTVVGLIEASRSRTAELATGNVADDPAAVQTKLEQTLEAIRSGGAVDEPERFQDVSYHDALTSLYDIFAAEHALRADMEKRFAGLEADVERLTESMSRQKLDFVGRSQEFADQLKELEAKHGQFRTERETQVSQIEQQFETRRKQTEGDLTRERQRSTSLENRLTTLEDRIHAFQARLGEQMPGPGKLATARVEDGRILTAVPGDDVVYIDLGRKDRVMLGLEFAVYSSDDGIPPDGRAKARIKVVNMFGRASECEIVRVLPNEIIMPGDFVANPVFDRDRPVTFFVIGDFDLDRDGLPDSDGVETIKSLITDWGGEVLADLSATTDFAVLGAEPPHPKPGLDSTPQGAARKTAMEQAGRKYLASVELAQTLAVPVLPQEVFLNFLGYGGRLASR